MRRSILIFVCCLAVALTGLILSGHAEAAPRGKGVTRDMLPKELLNIAIKDTFIPSAGKEAGVIRSVVGHAVVVHEDMRQAYFAAPGDKLYEKDVLFTLKKSRCRFKMHNEDVVTLGESTRLSITAFSDDRRTQEKRSSFGMAKGKAMFYTLRLFKHKGASMDVTTPTAVAGVRGTKFGVEVNEADGSTYVYAYEGSIYVTSAVTGETKMLQEGQGIRVDATGLGDPFAIPRDVWQQFLRDTSIEGEDIIGLGTEGEAERRGFFFLGTGDTDRSREPSDVVGPGTGERGAPPLDTGGIDTTSLTQQQETGTIEETYTPPSDPVSDPWVNASGNRVGYFAGMLTNSGASSLEEVFISTTLQDFDTRVWARGISSPSTDYLRADSGSLYVTWAVFGSGTRNSGNLQHSHPVITSALGGNSVMEWGSWTMPASFAVVGGSTYLVDNPGYYIFGQNTLSMSALTGTGTYSGSAYGTYWSSGGGIAMTGEFGCDVNFATAAISNFGLNVSGGGRSASISGASGAFSSGAYFDIAGGEWLLDGNTPDRMTASGSFYGDTAEAMGGVWGMYHVAGGTGAAGMFAGNYIPPIDPIPDPGVNAAGSRVGYFVGMLTNSGASSLEEVFVSRTRQDFASQVWARGLASPSTDYLRVDYESSQESPYLKWAVFGSGTRNSGDLQYNHAAIISALGGNSVMEWGSWTMPASFAVVGGSTYLVDNQGYYIFGQNTPSMANLTGTGSYSGSAYGAYWSAGGGATMTGTFGCDIDFATAAISNFGLSVSGGGRSASISGASGAFGSGAYFDIAGGNWLLDGNTPDRTSASGSFYGGSAEAMGGAWGMYHVAGGMGAAGIFEGAFIPPPPPARPVAHLGYFVGMLTGPGDVEPVYEGTYMSSGLQNFDSANAHAYNDDEERVTIDGTGGTRKYVTYLQVWGTDEIEGLPKLMRRTEIGFNAYMEWGSWTQPDAMTAGANDFFFDNRGYYIWGDVTTDAQMAALAAANLEATYIGSAHGTIWSAGGGINQTGAFSMDVKFNPGSIENFQVWVGGVGQTGFNSGTGLITGSSFSVLNNPSGQICVAGSCEGGSVAAYGSFYGPNAESAGGIWSVQESLGGNANGMFVGAR